MRLFFAGSNVRLTRWIAAVVVLGGIVGLAPGKAAAATTTAMNFSQLSDAFANGDDVILGADISGGALNVGAGQTLVLDLAGHDLAVSSSGPAAIGLPVGTDLTIVDASGDGTVTATGNSGAAGIGGGAGADGVNPAASGPAGSAGAAGAAGTVNGGDGLPGGNGNPGGEGGAGGAVAGTAPTATGGDGAIGGSGTAGANAGRGGDGGATSTTAIGATANGGNGGAGGVGGVGATTGGAGGTGGNAVSTGGRGNGGQGGKGGDGGTGAAGQAGGSMGALTILGGTVTVSGSGGAALGGGLGGDGDTGGNGGVGGAGGSGTGLGGDSSGGAGGVGGSGATGGASGAGGGGGTIKIAGATLNQSGGIGCGMAGANGAGGTAGANGANGASSLTARHSGSNGHRGAPALPQPNCGTLAIGPQAPTGVSAKAGHGSARVSFSAPSDAGNSAITSYTVTTTDETDSSEVVPSASGSGSPITVTGLISGHDYTFAVKATNDAGPGFISEPSSEVTAEDTDTTTGLASSDSPSASGQSVTFTATVAPAPDGGTVAFEADGTSLSGCTAQAVDPANGQATCEVSSLAPGTHSVVATYGGDAFSAGSESEALDQAVEPGAAPGPATPAATPGAIPPFPTDAMIIAGLREVRHITKTSRTLSFTQRIVAAGTIRWRMELSFYARHGADRKLIRIASGRFTAVTTGTIHHTITLGSRARAALKRHPRARFVLRTTERLTNRRVFHTTKAISRR